MDLVNKCYTLETRMQVQEMCVIVGVR